MRHKIEATLHLTEISGISVGRVAVLIPWAIVSRSQSTIEVQARGHRFVYLRYCIAISVLWICHTRSGTSGVGRRWFEMPFVMAVAIGISISQTRAVVEDMLGTGVFVRTPKWGVLSQIKGKYRSQVHWVVWLNAR